MKEKKTGGRGKFLAKSAKKGPSKAYAIPFIVALMVLTVIAFIIPLRPTRSMEEKRDLAAFPEFTWEALLSGDYFDDINLWFSDTFPGRESWLSLSASTKELHGIQDIVIHGDISLQETVPDEYVASTEETPPPELMETEPSGAEETQEPTQSETSGSEETQESTEPAETEPEETTPPTTPVEEWGGVNAGEDADIYLGSVIQIGDTAFNYFTFSQGQSDRFINTIKWYQEAIAKKDKDISVILAMIPTSVGVMVEAEYQEKIGCTDQGAVIDYIYSGIPDEVVKVEIFDTLVEHNDEYLYFRTDHHWTALGGYYCYQEVCEALGMEPAPLDAFEEWDQGEFQGSNYYKCNQSSKLLLDNVYAYNPPGDITMRINNENGRFTWPVLTDMSKSAKNAKYMTFLAGDHPLCEITNNDIPEGLNCVIVKDSYGNCVAPFFTQNYHNVYVVDFREYTAYNLRGFVDAYDIDHVIFLIQVGAAQDHTYNNLIRRACGF